MKRIIALILSMVVILSLCSCSKSSKANGYVKSAQKHGYYSLFNVSYGMPIEECKKALNVKEKDIKMISKAELGDGYKNEDVQVFTVSKKYLDKDVTAVFFFYGDETKTGHNLGLYEFRIAFKEPITNEDARKLVEKDLQLKKLSYENKIGGGIFYSSFRNNINISKLKDQSVKEKTLNLSNTMYGNLYKKKKLSISIDSEPLDSISILSMEQKNVDYISFMGRWAHVVGIATNQDIK